MLGGVHTPGGDAISYQEPRAVKRQDDRQANYSSLLEMRSRSIEDEESFASHLLFLSSMKVT